LVGGQVSHSGIGLRLLPEKPLPAHALRKRVSKYQARQNQDDQRWPPSRTGRDIAKGCPRGPYHAGQTRQFAHGRRFRLCRCCGCHDGQLYTQPLRAGGTQPGRPHSLSFRCRTGVPVQSTGTPAKREKRLRLPPAGQVPTADDPARRAASQAASNHSPGVRLAPAPPRRGVDRQRRGRGRPQSLPARLVPPIVRECIARFR
jgi:hypothetical protein